MVKAWVGDHLRLQKKVKKGFCIRLKIRTEKDVKYQTTFTPACQDDILANPGVYVYAHCSQ